MKVTAIDRVRQSSEAAGVYPSRAQLAGNLADDSAGNWQSGATTSGAFLHLLNVAVGGKFVGSPDSSTSFPQQMRADYVRAWGQ